MDKNLLLLKNLCLLNGPSGNESAVRDFILKEISDYCDAKTDKMGNIIAFKKGAKTPNKKIMLDAHMDEVGVIVTSYTENGLLRFDTVGGINTEALLCKRVVFNNIVGVIGAKPIHQSGKDERNALPPKDSLYIDIGANDKDDAENLVALGEIGTFLGEWFDLENGFFCSKAIDDRAGTAALISLLKTDAEYDFWATFTVGEELGLRGARTASYAVSPDYAIVLEATTASDIPQTPKEKNVCELQKGVAVSFMDRATLYDKKLVDLCLKKAEENDISVQLKRATAGGNNAGAIHLTKSGVPTLTLSLPCRYIHSPNSAASFKDFTDMTRLAQTMINCLAEEK